MLGNKIDLRKENSEYVHDTDVDENCTKLVEKYGKFNCEIKYFPISTLEDQYFHDCFTYLSENHKRYKDVLPKVLVLGAKNSGVKVFFKKYIIEDEFYMTDTVVKTFIHQNSPLGIEFILVPQFDYFKEDRKIKNRYYTKAQGLICVFDVTNRPSFNKVIKCVDDFLQANDEENLLISILGTNVAKRNNNPYSTNDPYSVFDQEAENYCVQVQKEANRSGLKIRYYPVSIETGLHVEKCFKSLIESVTVESRT